MNFIKTSKFSVKGIDTTRYIPTSEFYEEESPNIGKGKKTPSQLTPKETFYCVIPRALARGISSVFVFG